MTPFGRFVTEKSIVDLKPPEGVTVRVIDLDSPLAFKETSV